MQPQRSCLVNISTSGCAKMHNPGPPTTTTTSTTNVPSIIVSPLPASQGQFSTGEHIGHTSCVFGCRKPGSQPEIITLVSFRCNKYSPRSKEVTSIRRTRLMLISFIVKLLLCVEYRYLGQREDNHKHSFSFQIQEKGWSYEIYYTRKKS